MMINSKLHFTDQLEVAPELDNRFRQFAAYRQDANNHYWSSPPSERKKIIAELEKDLFKAYRDKLLGPLNKHCSPRTIQFCLDWFSKENDITLKEEALALYESRIEFEAHLTVIFESKFSDKIRQKYINFYRLEFDQKEALLAKIQQEVEQEEKLAQQQKAYLQLKQKLETAFQRNLLTDKEYQYFLLRFEQKKPHSEQDLIYLKFANKVRKSPLTTKQATTEPTKQTQKSPDKTPNLEKIAETEINSSFNYNPKIQQHKELIDAAELAQKIMQQPANDNDSPDQKIILDDLSSSRKIDANQNQLFVDGKHRIVDSSSILFMINQKKRKLEQELIRNTEEKITQFTPVRKQKEKDFLSTILKAKAKRKAA